MFRSAEGSDMSVFARCAWAAVAVFVLAYPMGAPQAAKPITGVSCGGGFFVKLRNNTVLWIHGEDQRKTVYSGGSPVFAMAECSDGVLTVFNGGGDGDPRYDVYYSADCLSIGTAGDNTTRIHSGRLPITRIVPDRSGVSLRLSDDSVVRSASCRLRTP